MIKKIDGPTPNGGAYSKIYYYDINGKSCDEKNAKKIIACEYDENDNLIKETTLIENEENDLEDTLPNISIKR